MESPNPAVGEPLRIPAGTPIRDASTGDWKPASRARTVTPTHVSVYADDWTVVTWTNRSGEYTVHLRGNEFVSDGPAPA